MAGEAAINLRSWAPDDATDPNMPVLAEGPTVAKIKADLPPSQWAVNVKYAGLLPTILVGLFGVFFWIANYVWLPWQSKFLGSVDADTKLFDAATKLVTLIDFKIDTEKAREESEKHRIAVDQSMADSLLEIKKKLDTIYGK